MSKKGILSYTHLHLFCRIILLQGIFLTDSAKNEYRVEKILNHIGTKVIFQAPASLATDEYTLEVRVLLKGNKNIKKGVLMNKLSV
jgi:hypothetical protein